MQSRQDHRRKQIAERNEREKREREQQKERDQEQEEERTALPFPATFGDVDERAVMLALGKLAAAIARRDAPATLDAGARLIAACRFNVDVEALAGGSVQGDEKKLSTPVVDNANLESPAAGSSASGNPNSPR